MVVIQGFTRKFQCYRVDIIPSRSHWRWIENIWNKKGNVEINCELTNKEQKISPEKKTKLTQNKIFSFLLRLSILFSLVLMRWKLFYWLQNITRWQSSRFAVVPLGGTTKQPAKSDLQFSVIVGSSQTYKVKSWLSISGGTRPACWRWMGSDNMWLGKKEFRRLESGRFRFFIDVHWKWNNEEWLVKLNCLC